MVFPDSDDEWLTRLAVRHDAELPELEMFNRYYDGTQPLAYMHPEVMREVEDRIQPVVIFWPQLLVDAVEERLDVTGFRLPDSDEDQDELWRVWRANKMPAQSQQGHVDMLVMRRYYVQVGANEDDADTPLVTAESPLEMFAEVDPRTRKTVAALKRIAEEGTYARMPERSATLILPDHTSWFDWNNGKWVETDRDEHNLGAVSVVPIVNRPRLSSATTRRAQARYGRSELSAVIPLSDAANKIATDMMLTAEGIALPLRGFLGIAPDDLEDADGNRLTAVQVLMKKFLTIPTDDANAAKPFDFAPASLNNFHESINNLAGLVAALGGLPPNYLGLRTDNPASADAMRSAESRLVRRCERKHTPAGDGYEDVGRLVDRFQTGEWRPDLRMLETVWADASTPTVAQKADAAVKKYSTQPEPIVPLRQTRKDLGYSATEIANMEAESEEAAKKRAELDPVGMIARDLAGNVPSAPVTDERDQPRR